MRTAAGFDVDKAQHVYRTWPLREGLLCFLHKLQQSAVEDYRNRLTQWASLQAMSRKKLDAPKPPAILKVRIGG